MMTMIFISFSQLLLICSMIFKKFYIFFIILRRQLMINSECKSANVHNLFFFYYLKMQWGLLLMPFYHRQMTQKPITQKEML